MKPECITERTDTLIVVRDKRGGRSKIIFENEKQELVKVVEVDDCEVKAGKRCDFLVLHPTKIKSQTIDNEYFIELKGSAVKHGCDQLEASINRLSENAKKKPKHAFVISSKSPLSSTEIQKIQRRFKKELNTKLIVKNKQYTFKLS